ncbi:S8 family serine peptidase [Tychonema sp. LEGE 07203]|uniref:S8 family serine peptidase n=1 Tax=Tychonema sp. LEGE 07203 TaxID=1828671 RepID=UPI00187E0EB4|nr:S8 family serine peptidase [Tychonema sp. LEGE 07203]MBE9097208.1 S8 family serine peptidase [Tychonema sp. LEGE 07203]
MQEFVPDSEEFILEAARRALSNSSLGYIAIFDSTEAAKFSSFEGENNLNIGEYRGIKTFAMTPGDEFGIILIPNGKIQEVYDNPGIGGHKKPLFSMATANSSDAFQPGQIASVVNGGNIFVMEDMGISEESDADYNDIIFSLKGATPKVILIDDVIAKNSDWRTSEKGKELIAYVAPKTETKLDDDKKTDTTSTTNPTETKPEKSPAVEDKSPTVSEIPNSETNPAETKPENSPVVEDKNPTVSEIPNSDTKPEKSPAVEDKNPTVSEIPNSDTKPENSPVVEDKNLTVSEIPNFETNSTETKPENSPVVEDKNPTVSEITNSQTQPENSPVVEDKNPTVSEIPNSETNSTETKTEKSAAVEDKNPTVSEIPNSETNSTETKTEKSPATETKNPTVSEITNSQTKPENSPVFEDKNPTVSEIPNSQTNPAETKPEKSPVVEDKNPTVSEIPNSQTNPAETKPENFPATETQKPTVSEISNFQTNPAQTEIDFITGDTIEKPVFLQPEIATIPTESTDILTGEIENTSPSLTNSPENAGETADNLPPISPDEISTLSETLNSILAQQFPNISSTASIQNYQPPASQYPEYIVADNQTIIPEIAVTPNHHSQQSENLIADSDNQSPTTTDEYVNPNFDFENSTITPEISSDKNNQPDNSHNIIADSEIATATDSNSETNINEYAATHTETQLQQELRTQTKETGFFDKNTSLLPTDSVKNSVSGLSVIPRETIPNSSQQNQPFIGIIDTGFTADNPNINYSQIILGKDVIDGDNNPLLQPKEGNQHGNTILEIISDSHNPSDTKQFPTIWLGRATGSGNWHQSLIEFVDSAIAAKQPNAVVNLSFDLTQINPDGTQTTRHKLTAAEQSALKYAQENNILIVAAAGNEGTLLSVLGQASTEFDNIITVGASENNNRAAYSSYGGGLDILAPTSTAQTVESSTTETKQGTSIAAAFVTNTISQMWAANPSLSHQQIKNLLLKTATDIDVPEWDERTGYGILDQN